MYFIYYACVQYTLNDLSMSLYSGLWYLTFSRFGGKDYRLRLYTQKDAHAGRLLGEVVKVSEDKDDRFTVHVKVDSGESYVCSYDNYALDAVRFIYSVSLT